MSTPTAEQIQAVREMECRDEGHRFVIHGDTNDDADGFFAAIVEPRGLTCDRCGAEWSVRP